MKIITLKVTFFYAICSDPSSSLYVVQWLSIVKLLLQPMYNEEKNTHDLQQQKTTQKYLLSSLATVHNTDNLLPNITISQHFALDVERFEGWPFIKQWLSGLCNHPATQHFGQCDETDHQSWNTVEFIHHDKIFQTWIPREKVNVRSTSHHTLLESSKIFQFWSLSFFQMGKGGFECANMKTIYMFFYRFSLHSAERHTSCTMGILTILSSCSLLFINKS